jgi:glycosyltransferase involved in cell wall biosynthesis
MKFIFTSYASSPEFTEPLQWLKRIEGYTGILEALAKKNDVTGIERISFEGTLEQHAVHYYFHRLPRKRVLFPRQLHRLIKKLNPRVVFINGLIFPLQVIQLRQALGPGVRIILIHRSEKPFTGIKKYLQRIADRYVHAYLFTSVAFGDNWVQKGNIRDIKKIHAVMHGSSVFHPADSGTAKKKLAVSGSPVFLWVGRLNANKDPLTVINAFKAYSASVPGARLYMIYHTEEMLEAVKEACAGSTHIILTGKVDHGDLQDWYNAADFIVSGSHYEGGGIAVCEAMSCGCIPIVTDIIAFRQMTGAGKCGLLYPPGNEKALLAALLSTALMDREKEKARVLEEFNKELSFEAIGRKIEQVIASLDK